MAMSNSKGPRWYLTFPTNQCVTSWWLHPTLCTVCVLNISLSGHSMANMVEKQKKTAILNQQVFQIKNGFNQADSLFSVHAECTLMQTHVVAVVASDISWPSDCTGLPWLSPQDCENICHSACHFPLWSERQVKVLPASLMTWYTWVPPTTVLINRQMEQEPQQIEQRFARIGPARLFRQPK